jgi:hypothetical protein
MKMNAKRCAIPTTAPLLRTSRFLPNEIDSISQFIFKKQKAEKKCGEKTHGCGRRETRSSLMLCCGAALSSPPKAN